MMRRMFLDVRSEFLWWFDDDSFVTSPTALSERLCVAQKTSPDIVMWGEQYMCEHRVSFCDGDPTDFVRSATWYRGLTPPSWEPGGKGEFNFDQRGGGDGRWIFLTGGNWFIRCTALAALDWPDPRLVTFGEDVFLGEAIRQHGWRIQHIGKLGVETNCAPRRWNKT
jgi:GT2 family glycosyltransferase